MIYRVARLLARIRFTVGYGGSCIGHHHPDGDCRCTQVIPACQYKLCTPGSMDTWER